MDDFNERYNRQLILQGFGEQAQRALQRARVLVVGAGGLGCPALLYLAAAGIGTIGIIDPDTVSLSNLHRQVLYTTEDIGLFKAGIAAKKITAINPGITVTTYPFALDPINAPGIIAGYDYVLDGSDNFSTRYLVNDVCVYTGKPFVYGAVSQYEGQVCVFNADAEGINYRDLFPVQPGENEFPNCAEAGVIGALPGIIGTMQAAELIKLITGIGQPLSGRLLTYDLLSQEIFTVSISKASPVSYQIPASPEEFAATDYGDGCRGTGAETNVDPCPEISIDQLAAIMQNPDAVLIDVREPGETPVLNGFQYRQVPLSVFPSFATGIEGDPVILFCQSGSRSQKAALILKGSGNVSRKIFSVKHGVMSQNEKHA